MISSKKKKKRKKRKTKKRKTKKGKEKGKKGKGKGKKEKWKKKKRKNKKGKWKREKRKSKKPKKENEKTKNRKKRNEKETRQAAGLEGKMIYALYLLAPNRARLWGGGSGWGQGTRGRGPERGAVGGPSFLPANAGIFTGRRNFLPASSSKYLALPVKKAPR